MSLGRRKFLGAVLGLGTAYFLTDYFLEKASSENNVSEFDLEFFGMSVINGFVVSKSGQNNSYDH